MTKYQITNSLRQLIESSCNIPPSLKSRLLQDDQLTHNDLIEFYNLCKPTDTLLDLMKLTKLAIPNKNITPTKPKTKEYLALMERLRLEEKEREYKRLITPTPEYETLYDNTFINDSQEQQSMSQMHKELKHQLTTIINILISVGSVAYAIWYWTESSWGLPVSYRLLLSIFLGLLVLIAEVVVYMGYLNKIEEARIRERKKKEVKKVIRTVDLKNQV